MQIFIFSTRGEQYDEILSISAVTILLDNASQSCFLSTEFLESMPLDISLIRFLFTSYPKIDNDVDSWQYKGNPTYPKPITSMALFLIIYLRSKIAACARYLFNKHCCLFGGKIFELQIHK